MNKVHHHHHRSIDAKKNYSGAQNNQIKEDSTINQDAYEIIKLERLKKAANTNETID